MKLVVLSHKLVSRSPGIGCGYSTDGGFPMQMEAISELFDQTTLVLPCGSDKSQTGLTPLSGKNLSVVPIAVPQSSGVTRKLGLPIWVTRNARCIWNEIRAADAVHAPIPGDVGTVGILLALVMGKPLFVRHCGNWAVQRTAAEFFWKWCMERFAGGKNVMMATGGAENPPSPRNSNVSWIFSTSLKKSQIVNARARTLSNPSGPKLITACRLEPRKGVDVVIKSLPIVREKFPDASLEVLGGGSLLSELKRLADETGVADRVRFHGKISQMEVLEKLRGADVFCFATSASEGFPKAVLEALASGLPIVTTGVSVLPSLMRRGGGTIVESATERSVAAAIGELCADPDAYKKASAAALETAKFYSLEAWQEKIAKALCKGWNVESLSSEGGPAPFTVNA